MPDKRISIKQILVQVFFLGIAGLLIYMSVSSLSSSDWDRILNLLGGVNYGLAAMGFTIIALSHLCRSERWLILVDGESPEGYSFSFKRSLNAFGSLMIGYLANMAVPRLGEVLRCVVLSRYEKKNTMELVGTIFVERAFDFVCLMLVFAMTLGMEYHILSEFIGDLFASYIQSKNWGLFLGLLCAGAIAIILLGWYAIRKSQKIRTWIVELKRGVFSFYRIRRKKMFLFYTILMWFLYIGGVRLALVIFPETSHLSWDVATAIIAIGSVAMIITQGGIGAYQYMVMQMLALYGITQYVGFTIGWFLWLLLAAASILLGGVSYVLLPYVNRKNKS